MRDFAHGNGGLSQVTSTGVRKGVPHETCFPSRCIRACPSGFVWPVGLRRRASCPDAHCDIGSHANRHGCASPDVDAHADVDTYGNTNAHANAYSDLDTGANGDSNACPNLYALTHGNAGTDRDASANTRADGYTTPYGDTDTITNARTVENLQP